MDDLDALVTTWLAAPATADLAHVRAVTRAEIDARRAKQDGCGDALVGLCFLLYLIGEPTDVLLIDDAKHANFDADCTIDRDFYQMRRTRDAMLAAAAGRPRAEKLVHTAFDAPNYESPAEFEAYQRHYFGV